MCSYERCKLTRGLEHADPYGECQHITCNELLTLRVAPQAGVLAELQPTHVLATDKELVKQQRSELHAAKEAKLAAEQQAGKEAAAAQRIAAELELSQAKVAELCDQILGPRRRTRRTRGCWSRQRIVCPTSARLMTSC